MLGLVVAVLVSHIGVLVASVLVSDLVGNPVTSIVLVVSVLVLMGVSRAVLLLQGETMRAGAMVSLVAAMRVIFLMTMSGIGGVSRVSRVTRVIRVTRVFLELNVSALVAAVVGMVLGHIVMQLLTVHLRLESLVLVGGVVDSALVAIGIDQLVVSSHLVPIAMLAVLLHIASLVILDAVLEVVLGMRVMLVVLVAMMMIVMLVMMGSLLVMMIIVRHQMHGGMTGGRLMITMEGGCLHEGGTGQQGEGCNELQKQAKISKVSW